MEVGTNKFFCCNPGSGDTDCEVANRCADKINAKVVTRPAQTRVLSSVAGLHWVIKPSRVQEKQTAQRPSLDRSPRACAIMTAYDLSCNGKHVRRLVLKKSAASTDVGTLNSEERTRTSQRTFCAQAAALLHCFTSSYPSGK